VSRIVTRRRFLVLAGAGAVMAAPAAALAARSGDSSDDLTAGDAPGADQTPPTTHQTAAVAIRDLSTTVTASGSVGYGETRTVMGANKGTITSLPLAGLVIERNQPLYGVNGGEGPVLLTGELPPWRDLNRWVDDGADVAQLETNLAELGLASAELTVDQEFTALTTDAVEAWQEAHGWDDTGQVAFGDVWFSPGPVRVASVSAALGTPDSGEIMTVTGTERRVLVDVDSSYGHHLTEGGAVVLTLPDGSTVGGTATDVADVVTVVPASQPGETDTSTIAVVVTPEAELDVLDDTPISVEFQVDTITGALAVPVEAVVATTDGRYALEVVDEAGSTSLVEVTLGRFADGWVQVTGDIQEGQEVVTA
jgi:multidrug efflux pump subunit AcrA (membrane-fusion protein)